jgi:hypothetical protein
VTTARRLSRRDFFGVSGSAAATLALFGPARALAGTSDGPYGALVPIRVGRATYRGCHYRVLSPEGAPTMRNAATSGLPVPATTTVWPHSRGPGKLRSLFAIMS